jgi:hypothetical protein
MIVPIPKQRRFKENCSSSPSRQAGKKKKTNAPRCIAITLATTTVVTDGILWLYKLEKGHTKKEGGRKKMRSKKNREHRPEY